MITISKQYCRGCASLMRGLGRVRMVGHGQRENVDAGGRVARHWLGWCACRWVCGRDLSRIWRGAGVRRILRVGGVRSHGIVWWFCGARFWPAGAGGRRAWEVGRPARAGGFAPGGRRCARRWRRSGCAGRWTAFPDQPPKGPLLLCAGWRSECRGGWA